MALADMTKLDGKRKAFDELLEITFKRGRFSSDSEDSDETSDSDVEEIAGQEDNRPRTFRLFDLPAELRNVVYEKIAEDQTAEIRSRKKFLTDRSGLLGIEDRLRDEYLPILLLHSSELAVQIIDFDFGKLISFFNRLSDAEVNALPSTSKPAKGRFTSAWVVAGLVIRAVRSVSSAGSTAQAIQRKRER